jgi:peptidoglycan/xylan/chitin deacetylase (PgdA/CDA1 family)
LTRRAALLSGLAVLVLLLGGQVVTGWNGRSPAPARAAAPPAGSTTDPTPSPLPTPSKPSRTQRPTPPRPPVRPNQPPAGGGRAAYLAAIGVKRTTAGGGVALTFDDGPNPIWTPQILAMLRQHRVRAVFCVVGTEVHQFPWLVAQIVREGHALCNHSWHHELNMGTRPDAEIRANLLRTNAEIRKAAPGAKIAYYRQPGGLWTQPIALIARSLGMTPLGWNVDPSDWEEPTTAQIQSRVMAQSRRGSVILMHDGGGDRATTVAACRTLIPGLKNKFRIVPLR